MNELKKVRYTINDVNNNRYYQMPKFLFEGELISLSNDARILYSLLRDRHQLSITNNWINERNEVFLIFTREDMAELLGCSQPTLRKAIKQLIETGLIEEERQGANKPNLIYLTAVNMEFQKPVESKVKNIKGLKKDQIKNSDSEDEILNKNIAKQEDQNYDDMECKKLSVPKGSETSLHSGVKESFIQDCKILSPNKTNINNTDISNTDKSINQSIDNSIYTSKKTQTDGQTNIDISKQSIDKCRKIIEQCEIDKIDEDYRNAVIHSIRLLIMDIENKKVVKIGENLIPSEIVGNDLEKLNFLVLEHAVNKFKVAAGEKEIRNKITYLKACIYNSIHEMNIDIDSDLRSKGLI